MQVQALGDLLDRFPDPLLHRTFGGCIAGPGLVAADNQTLRSAQPGKRQQAAVYVLTAQAATPAAWEERLDKLVQTAGAVELDRAREEHRRWWDAFWNRSWIFVDCDKPLTLPEGGPPWRVGVDSNGGNRFRGQIVQPRVIGRALSADEIAQLAAAPRGEETALQEEKMAGGCTTAAWIKPAAGEIGRILEKGGILFDTHSGKATDAAHPGLALRWIVGDRTMTHPICLKPGEWQHVAATADAGGVRRIYLNGKPVMEERIPGGGETPTRGYVLQRFINACGGRGAFPIKFNGSIFTVDGVDGGQHCNADYRRWGGCYWFQNTRLAYWPMLYAGDFDLMQPLFRMYREALPLARERTRKYYKHGGAFFPETMYFWGTYANDNYGWKRQGKPDGQIDNFYIRNYWDGALELTTMMLEYHAQTGDERYGRETLLPLAQEVLAFYEQHYPQRDAQGKIVFSPANSLETYASVKNPLPVVAGLRYVTQRILSDLPEAWAGELRAQCQRLRPLLPDLPAKTEDGQTRLLPFDGFEGKKGNNTENPELYAVFPYRLYGLGLPELAIGRATFDKRMVKGTGGWYQDAIQAALLGVTDTAAAYTYQNFSTKHKESRFPAFWGPNSDWIPDQDHGGVSMIALQRMLMQCDGDRILLLPAWPREWNVDFQLCAPRQTTVRAVWRDGKLATLEVTPAARRADVVLPETR